VREGGERMEEGRERKREAGREGETYTQDPNSRIHAFRANSRNESFHNCYKRRCDQK
jgi:hypothetical protein